MLKAIVGVDSGVANTGFVALDLEGSILLTVFSEAQSKVFHDRVLHHLYSMEKLIETIGEENGIRSSELIFVFEGYAFGARGTSFIQTIELTGAMKYLAFKKNSSVDSIPPSSVKKFFTGSGNATKGDMIAASFEKKFFRAVSHVVDAYAVALCFLNVSLKQGGG